MTSEVSGTMGSLMGQEMGLALRIQVTESFPLCLGDFA
jgi:hypothetical protein